MEPFSSKRLFRIFRVYDNNPEVLVTRESSTIEFKANFHLGRELDRYGKTIAAFANAKGGYIIFGVSNRPRKIIGMTNKKFVDLDPDKLTNYLNNKFSPEIFWKMHTHFIETKEIGIIYVDECSNKPVIAKSDGDEIKEGDIFYRYRGRTERIKYPELLNIIEDNRQKVHHIWFKHLSRIAKIGAENAAIFDPHDGTVTGKSGQFVIDKSLLSKLRFIKEGEFKEVTGSPAIKIVGQAEVLTAGNVAAERIKVETKVIHSSDLIDAFLKMQEVTNPIDYIIEICHGNTAYLPIYFFIRQTKLNLNDIIQKIKCTELCNLGVKSRLIDRLSQNDPRIHYKIPNSDTPLTQKKVSIRKAILSKNLGGKIIKEDFRHVFLVIQSLKKNEIDIDYIFPILYKWYKDYWKETIQFVQTDFRKAICHIDYELFKDKTVKKVQLKKK